MTQSEYATFNKVPAVTLGFWIIKILATTLGETGGDSVTMSWLHADQNPENGGYLIGTGIFLVVFIAAVIAQITRKTFNPWIYWLAIVASTTVGTAMADFFDRSLGIGYAGGSTVLFLCVIASLGCWYWSEGTISVNTVSTPRIEAYYWLTITFSQTLGTALGDWVADTDLGYGGGALVFGAGLLVLAIRHGDRLALAMDARAFGSGPRSTFRPLRWGVADVAVGIGGVLLLVVALLGSR